MNNKIKYSTENQYNINSYVSYMNARLSSISTEVSTCDVYLENEKLDRNFLNCFKKKLDVSSEKEMRTNKYLIKLVKEYQKAFPEGDENSWFGKWCYNVVSIPDDVEYEIDEPEGCNECVREVHRVWLFNGKQVGKNKNEIKK